MAIANGDPYHPHSGSFSVHSRKFLQFLKAMFCARSLASFLDATLYTLTLIHI